LVFLVSALICTVRQPAHRLPPGRRRTIWHGVLWCGCVRWVRRTERTLATNANQGVAVWSV